jgi:hypothetical protein
MTDEKPTSESKPSESKTSLEAQAKIAAETAQTLIRWMPLGASSISLGSALLQQNWFMAVVTFPIMIVTVIWARYTEGFLKRIGDVFEERGTKDVDSLIKWLTETDQVIRSSIYWQLAGTDDKYLKCQGYSCRDYEVEGQFLQSFIPRLSEVFVPLELSDLFIQNSQGDRLPMFPGFQGTKGVSQPLNQSSGFSIWELLKNSTKIPAYRHLVILAWGGYGKTTLLRHVTYIYTQKKSKLGVPKLLPVLLKLRDWQGKLAEENCPDLPEFIEQNHIPALSKNKLSLPPKWAENHLHQGKMLILLDGFDEVRPEWRKPVSDWIASQMKHYHKSYFILTSRPAGYKDFPSENKHFTGQLFIKKFNLEQQEKFIWRWYLCQESYARGGKITPSIRAIAGNYTSNLVEQLSEREELADLAKNPLMLNMIANLHRSYSGEKLPQRRTELYRDILQLQLWDRPRIKRIEMLLNLSQSQQVLQGLALSMVQENTPQMDDHELKSALIPCLNRVDDSVDYSEFLKQIEQVSELLVKKDEFYEFAHLSFQGYLAAAEIKRTQNDDLLLQNWQSSWWKETILLYVAQLRNPSSFIRRLIDLKDEKAIALAYECLKETPREVDPEVAAELENLSSTVKNTRYQKLENFLKNQQFQEADEETYCLMIETVGKEKGQWFDPEDFESFPCDELRKINQLWLDYSKGKFGFSVQAKIYRDLGDTRECNKEEVWYKFCDHVGWRSGDSWTSYSSLNFTCEAIVAHLPVLYWSPFFKHHLPGNPPVGLLRLTSPLSSSSQIYFLTIFSRLKTCNLENIADIG